MRGGPRRLAHLAIALAGFVATAVMARHADLGALRAMGAGWLVVALLEGLRVYFEYRAARALCGRAAVGAGRLLHLHLTTYAIATALPLGRLAAEAAKAVVLSRDLGAERATRVAATLQASGLLATAAWSVPCAVAAGSLGASSLARVLLLQCALLGATGAVLLGALRSERMETWLRRWVPGWRSFPQGVRESEGGALAWLVAQRTVAAAQLGWMMALAGTFDARSAVGLSGAVMVAGSVGDAVPAQLGVLGGALAWAAPGLHVGRPRALAMAMAIHGAQLAWTIVGALLSWVARESPTGESRAL